jgi:predicted ATPase/DNA-binding CsgD family transcriptional regulator
VTTQPLPRISGREAEVLTALGERLSNAQIASRLHLSVRTVETHVSSLLRKLGAADRHELAAMAPALVVPGAAAAPGAGSARGLPATWTTFVGRTRELRDVLSALEESRLVTVLGPGGAGKTRLAAVVAEQQAAALPLGATFVELRSARRGFLTEAVASVLGVAERPGRELQESVIERLRHGRGLLVLDNCEHLVADSAAFISALLAATSDLLVLTTSRERIGVVGERVVAVGGMSVVSDSTGGAAKSDAVQLFIERARSLDPSFDAEPAQIGTLCADLDGMPLAIELATARLAMLGIGGLRAGLADRLRLLSGGRSPDERHRSLRAMLDWSHELLDDDERLALRRLGRFAGDFDLAAAAGVTDLPTGVLADLIGRLADKSMLVPRRSDSRPRWAMLDTVRAYALDKLTAAGEAEDTLRRYGRWAESAAGELERRVEASEEWHDDLDAIVDDLRSALAETGKGSGRTLARSLAHLTYARRFLSEACQHYVTAAEHAASDAEAAEDLWLAAHVAHSEQRGERYFELATAAAERASRAGDVRAEAAILAEAVSVASRFPAVFENDVSTDRLQQLLATAERSAPADDVAVQARVIAARAWTETRLVEVPDRSGFRAALAAARRADDPVTISAMLDAVTSTETMAGRLQQTYAVNRERIALLPRLPAHDPPAGMELHDVVHMAAENAITVGELPDALAWAQRLHHDQTIPASLLMATSKPIVPLVLSGRFDEAIAHGRQTRVVWEDQGSPTARWLAPTIYAVALALALTGNSAESVEWRRLAVERVAGVQSKAVHFQVSGMATFSDARVALHEGRFGDAVRAIADIPAGDGAWWQVRHWYFDAYPWAIAAEVAVAAGAPDAAARLAAAAPAGAENAFAGAMLARARGRATGSQEELRDSVERWERIGARFERACTLVLMDDRAAEGRAELAALGVAAPHE